MQWPLGRPQIVNETFTRHSARPRSFIDDMHRAFDVACAKLRLAPTSDKATELVAAKIVELAQAGARGDDLTDKTLSFFEVVQPEGRTGT
jgi:hypothetical protein